MLDVISNAPMLGALARRVAEGSTPAAWGIATPQHAKEWRQRANDIASAPSGSWLAPLTDALELQGVARDRLAGVADRGGVLVTTGQQPGLFGGPLYTWYKALTALALANAIEKHTGVPAAPLFWAATDDSDIAEAAWTAVAVRGGAKMLQMSAKPPDGTPMALVQLGDVSREIAELRAAAGAVAYPELLAAATDAYSGGNTVGGAYIALLRSVLQPLGIAVLDAAHDAVRTRADAVLRNALANAEIISAAVSKRNEEIRDLGMEPQVHEVAGLSLVFVHENGLRRRVPTEEARRVAEERSGVLSPNVLLRPVVERSILPTVAYVGGPAELAYFAQAAAVSDALKLPAPVAVPRFSGTVVEEHVRRIMHEYQIGIEDLAAPHAVWTRLARSGVHPDVLAAFGDLRRNTDAAFERLLRGTTQGDAAIFDGPEIVRGAQASMEHRILRFERRVIAAAKRRDTKLADDIATARGALFPLGKRQERALNMIPLLARHGDDLLQKVLDGATAHAERLVMGGAGRVDDLTAVQVSAVSARD